MSITINNRRYQTLPNLKKLGRKKSKEREESPRVFEGLFASLSGTNFLSKYGAGGSYGRQSRKTSKEGRNLAGSTSTIYTEDRRRHSNDTYYSLSRSQTRDERRRFSSEAERYPWYQESRNNYEYLRDRSSSMGSQYFFEDKYNKGISFLCYQDEHSAQKASGDSCEDLRYSLQNQNPDYKRVLGRRETRELYDTVNNEKMFAYGEYIEETPKKARVFGRNEDKKKFAVRRLLSKEKVSNNINDEISEQKKDQSIHELLMNGLNGKTSADIKEMQPVDKHWTGVKGGITGCKENLKMKLSLPDLSNKDKVERLSEYDKYFASLLVDTHPDHPDYQDLQRHSDHIAQLATEGDTGEDGELERIQELFPHDNLRLHERGSATQKMKGLMRKRSTTAARLQRAFSAKSLRSPEGNNHQHNNNKDTTYNNNNTNSPNNSSNANNGVSRLPSNRTKEGRPKRQFIMETPVQFTTGVQSQERHLFLFTDLLLVAKARSGGNFKLKEKVRVSEMWLGSCVDDVAEVTKSLESSFVLGWPTTNVVASFSCVATKDLWFNKLSQVIAEEREKEPSSSTIQVTYYDPHNNTDICKTVNITSTTTAKDCIGLILEHLEIHETDVSKFQLWVKTGNDESPYPLIGHEFPFAIRMNCARELLQDCETEECNNLYYSDIGNKCQFILRQAHKLSFNNSPEGVKKISKKARKSPIRIHKVFKRSNSKGDTIDGPNCHPTGALFGQHLVKLYGTTGAIPKPVMDMMNQLFLKGPFTLGIFRKSANARLVRELREKLDLGEEPVDFENVHIMAVAALLKDFLRSLPDCLLCSDLYEEWLDVPHIENARDRISRTLLLCSRLPRPYLLLLQHFLCVLYHIVRRSSENKMSASNLAVCVGPSLLWPPSPVLALSPEASKQAPAVIEFLVESCGSIFGEDMLLLFGNPPEQDPMRQDSGAEESDSLHSLHSGHSLHSSGGLRRDDSSIDSLEREYMVDGELSPLPRKDKMSLTNLSRDSGLTMSDSQLYTPDEEESESTSSGHSGGDKNGYLQNNTERGVDKCLHYSAPNNPFAIYTAVYRKPEKTTILYDEPDGGYYAAPNRDHARVHITYSTPGNQQKNVDSNKEYTRVYPSRHERISDAYLKGMEDDGIYSTPTSILGANNNSNFQRHDWMRRRSNLRKVSRTNSGEGGLIRTTSEESLLNKYNGLEYGMSLGPCPSNSSIKRQISHTNNMTPPPPPEEFNEPCSLGGRESPIRRSKSAYHLSQSPLKERNSRSPDHTPAVSRSSSHDAVSWHRSRSTSHIHDESDPNYDSSTLSDDDSTPHVSRSNSRGKEYGGGNTSLYAWDESTNTLRPLSDSGDSHNSRNSSFKSERTGSMCTVVSAGSTSTLASNPPSYEEALCRRSMMQKQNNNQPGSPSPSNNSFNEYIIREEKIKSAKAKQLYADSLRKYEEEHIYPSLDLVRASLAHAHDSDDSERPPPLPPKSEAPPLPPKQRNSRRMSEGVSSRLKHLPPVHVDMNGRKMRSVTSLTSPPNGLELPYHKTIIYTEDNPPSIPPKDKIIIEVEPPYQQHYSNNHVSVKSMRSGSPIKIEKKSIETQTDDCDLIDDEVRDEGIQTSGSWGVESHITSVPVPDSTNESRRFGRSRRRDSSASQRSRSVPSREPEQQSDSEDKIEDDIYGDSHHEIFSKSSFGLQDLKRFENERELPTVQMSVSSLRQMFDESLNGVKSTPPPYRHPPSASRAPITSYHLGAGESHSSRKSRERPRSNYGEESYV